MILGMQIKQERDQKNNSNLSIFMVCGMDNLCYLYGSCLVVNIIVLFFTVNFPALWNNY
jgi:hypothetical protein